MARDFETLRLVPSEAGRLRRAPALCGCVDSWVVEAGPRAAATLRRKFAPDLSIRRLGGNRRGG